MPLSNDTHVARSGHWDRRPELTSFRAKSGRIEIDFNTAHAGGISTFVIAIGPGDFEKVIAAMVEANRIEALRYLSAALAGALGPRQEP